jgi:hypothetical protein
MTARFSFRYYNVLLDGDKARMPAAITPPTLRSISVDGAHQGDVPGLGLAGENKAFVPPG